MRNAHDFDEISKRQVDVHHLRLVEQKKQNLAMLMDPIDICIALSYICAIVLCFLRKRDATILGISLFQLLIAVIALAITWVGRP
jgi:uncharacterized membrane protein